MAYTPARRTRCRAAAALAAGLALAWPAGCAAQGMVPGEPPGGWAPGPAPPNYFLGDTTMALEYLDTSVYPYALCNDGSPGAYYFLAGAPESDLWMVYLQGGFWCWDQASCEGRQANVGFEMTSSKWPSTMEAGGIFSHTSSQNPWASANKVYVGYCSSDAWMGAAPASTATYGFHFQGQNILASTIHQLGAKGLTTGHKLLLAGCSAGGRGVLVNLDKIAALGEEVGVTVTGMIDSGIWVDIEPPAPAPGGSAVVSLQTQTQGVYNLVNPSAIVPPQCADDNQGAEWKCLFGQYRMPYLTTPYFANQAQFDTFQLEYDVGGNPPTTAAQVAFADSFQQASLAVVNSLPTPQQQGSGMFSTSCLLHCVTDGPDFWTVTVNGQSLENALSAWYFKGSAPVRIVDNSCQGWACHTACIADERPPATANGGGGTNAPVGSGNSGSSGGGTASDEGSGGLPWTALLGQERSAEKANLTALAASGTPLTAAQQQELASLDADPYLSGGGGGGSGGGSGSGGGGGAQYETVAQRSQAQGAMQVTASEPRLTTSQSAALNQFLLQQNGAQASEAVAAHRSAVTSVNAGSSTYPGAAGRRLLRAA